METDNLSLPNFDDIQIQLTDGDAAVLKKYISEIQPPNCYLEIGTAYGGSALWANMSNPNIDIYSVDPNSILDAFGNRENIGNIHFIKKASLVAARDFNKPIGVLFIDGCHDQAQQDFGAWEKYVAPGGYILFHDYAEHSPKVKQDCLYGIGQMCENYNVLYTPDMESPTSILQARKIK